MRILAPAALALVLGGCAIASSEPREDHAVSPQRPPATEKLHIHVATAGVRLGAYTFRLQWDPSLAVIERVIPCNASKFPGAPECDEMKFNAGSIRIWGLTTRKTHDVPEEYDLVTIVFRGVRPARVPVRVEVEALYDMQKKPAPITGRMNVYPAELDFTK